MIELKPYDISMYKTYINFEKKERFCVGCKKVLAFKFFSITQTGMPRNNCKKCISKDVTKRTNARNLLKFPDLYHQCKDDECCNVFKKNLKGECPKCGMEVS